MTYFKTNAKIKGKIAEIGVLGIELQKQERKNNMIQLLEKKTGVRIIVFALLLTILAWLVPSNIGQANAETTDETGTTLLEHIKEQTLIEK